MRREHPRGSNGAAKHASAAMRHSEAKPHANGRRRLLQITRLVSAWFGRSARKLPWRTKTRKAYAALVSEAMLQQTQVSRVIDAYRKFLRRFPTIKALA